MAKPEPHIVKMICHPYRIPFRQPFATAHGELLAREGAIFEIVTDTDITGVGEVVTLPEFDGPSLEVLLGFLEKQAVTMQGSEISPMLQRIRDYIPHGINYAPTLNGLEIALLDILGKLKNVSIAQLLAVPHTLPRANVLINATIGVREISAAIEAARSAVAAGFSCIKLKVGIDATVEEEIRRISMVRTAIGATPQLRLDANEGWDFARARAILAACKDFHIEYVEQPLPRDQLAEMHALRQTTTIPIAADEAISNQATIKGVLDATAADILIIKPSLLNGLYAAQYAILRATKRQVRCVITSAIETGVGVTAALHLAAAMPQVDLACGLATLPLLADDLLVEPLQVAGGMMRVPDGPGLGVTVDWEKLAQYEIDVP